tara:strand:+ start:318 stop:674 length:357 start_codon:yes stop_codon:yes gene_type:complete
MTARDQLADRIALILDPDALDPVAQEVARNVAEAVIGMVRPLEWSEIDERTAFSRRRYVSGGYIIEYRLHGQHFDLWVGHNATCADRYNTLEAAKAAANAHHRAQILAALGLDAGEGR